MNIYEFMYLDKFDRENKCSDIKCIATRFEKEMKIELYHIDNYFLEVCFGENQNKVNWIQLSKKLCLLEAYTKSIDISSLNGLFE